MKSIDELNKIKNKYAANVTIRTGNYDKSIIVGMGNSGLDAGARDILREFAKRIEDEGLNSKVIVTQEARVSKSGFNPVVKIVENGTETARYANVTAEMADRIVEEHIKGGKIIDEYILAEVSNEEV